MDDEIVRTVQELRAIAVNFPYDPTTRKAPDRRHRREIEVDGTSVSVTFTCIRCEATSMFCLSIGSSEGIKQVPPEVVAKLKQKFFTRTELAVPIPLLNFGDMHQFVATIDDN